MTTLNKQEVFDKVARHLLTQKKKATVVDVDCEGGEKCRYRGDGNTKCAIGCLIPDGLYDPKMEGMMASSLVCEYPELLALFDYTVDPSFLQLLQVVHDSYPPEKWKDGLANVAKRSNLNADVLKEFE